MKRVMQLHSNGCVPATIAMLTGFSYLRSMRLIYPWKKTSAWEKHGTRHQDMLDALQRIGFRIRERKPINFPKLHGNAIIVVEHPIYGPPNHRSHVVVWDYEQQRILDPYVGFDIKRHLRISEYQKAAYSIIEVR